MSNGSDDLWSQIYLLDKGERLGETVTKFRLQYYLPGDRKGYVVYNWVPLPDTVDKITAKISDICVSMKQEDWLELPDFIPIMRRVELPDEAREAYREVLREAYARLRDGSEITAATAGVVTGKLQQIANGSVYDADREVHGLHTAKQEQLEAILEESAALGEHVLVYYAYQHDLGSIMYAAREYKTQVLRGPANVAAWNAGEIEVLIAHPDSAGHGLNLQDGGHVIVWYGLTWSLEKYLQANARLHRQGQKSPVRAYHIIGAKTVDERIMRLLEARKEGLDYVQAVLKAEIKEMDE
jgi:SNF2 family DNA or RNA helicase